MKKLAFLLLSHVLVAGLAYYFFVNRGASGDHGGHAEEAEHGHGAESERPGLVYTHFTPHAELFVEFDSLTVGLESAFAAHLNDVKRFKPLASGRVEVILSGGNAPEEKFAVEGPSVPGIFRPVANPKVAGKRRLVIRHIASGITDEHDLGEITVYATEKEAIAAAPAEEAGGGGITYLKEQAWKTDFATVPVEMRELRQSVAANAMIRAKAGGDASLVAPTQGKVIATAVFPHVGMSVKKGELLANFAPFGGEGVDVTQLEFEVKRSRSQLDLARQEFKRAQELFTQSAVPERRLQDAQVALEQATAAYEAASTRLQQVRAPSGGAAGKIPLRSPLNGSIAEVHTAPGTLAAQGDVLFRIVDATNLWLEVNVPEAELGRALGTKEAWFEIDGMEPIFRVGGKNPGRMLASGAVVDSKTRTTQFLFEFPNPQGMLKVGMFAKARLLSGKPTNTVAVPLSAIVDDGGQPVVYVQLEGESFERRPVTTGVREGDWVSIAEGVQAGERVVSVGAYNLKLASSGGAVPAHGHAH